MNARTTQQFVSIAVAMLIAAGLATVGTAQVSDPNAPWEASDLFAST